MDELLKISGVRKRLLCSQAYAYKLIEQGRLPAIRIQCEGNGKRKKHLVRVRESDLEAFIIQHHSGS